MVIERHDGIWERGGLWVVAQFPLAGLVFLAGLRGPRLPARLRAPARWLGVMLVPAGGALFLTGTAALGSNLTPFPKPSPDARLVTTGPYGLARHPLYGGIVVAALGWGLFQGRWLGLLGALVLAAFFDAKASREEHWLTEQFPEYPSYRRRVRKLVPWLY